ncbi:phage tail family protein [Geobacillus stearothermophilus]|nr:phage tail family protein [Geobacillus stearothermophilus]
MILSYAGNDTPSFLKIKKISHSILPPQTIYTLSIPARHGEYYTGRKYGPRVITVDYRIDAPSRETMYVCVDLLAWWLKQDGPAPLILSDAPDRLYYAIVQDNTDYEQLLMYGHGQLTFLCPDPFAYSTIEKTVVPDANGVFLFDNQGTTETFPVFKVNFQNPATFVSFTSPDGIILIGNPKQPDKIVLPKTQTILNDPMESTNGWVNAGSLPDEKRINTGSVVADVNGIKASDYGSGTGVWHGPAIRKTLSEPVQNFEVRVRMYFRSEDGTSKLDGNQMGRLEIYLFDQNGGKIGKLIMRDSYTQYEFNVPEITIGNETFLTKEPAPPKPQKVSQTTYTTYVVKSGDTLSGIAAKFKTTVKTLQQLNGIKDPNRIYVGQKLKVASKTTTKEVVPTHVGDYNDFFGEFTLSRVGNKWYAEVSRIDESTWKKSKTITRTYYDVSGKYTSAQLSYLVIHFAQWDANPIVGLMKVTDVKVLKHNTDTVIEIPEIFQPGDELEVNLTDSSVWLNGDLFMQEVDVGSTFFPIYEGQTEVKVNTDDPGATFEASFFERFL